MNSRTVSIAALVTVAASALAVGHVSRAVACQTVNQGSSLSSIHCTATRLPWGVVAPTLAGPP